MHAKQQPVTEYLLHLMHVVVGSTAMQEQQQQQQ
jgi:hypothetical protein